MRKLVSWLALLASPITTAWTLEPAAPLLIPRAAHQAVALPDASLLLTGGCAEASCAGIQRSSERFDARSGRSRPTGAMREARVSHMAAALPDGRVLVVGGWTGSATTASGEIFDPHRERFTPLPAGLHVPRMDATLTPLADASLLAAGGARALNQPVAELERFMPAALRFEPAGRLLEARAHHSATRLNDGRVLIVGGLRARGQGLASAELFDPATGRSLATGALSRARCKHAAVALPDGRVLVIGGSPDCGERQRHADSEIYDPASGRFSPGPLLRHGRYKIAGAAALLPDGAVLVAGDAPEAEIWTPGRPRFEPLPTSLGPGRAFVLASPLPGGEVLVSGGYDDAILPTSQTWRLRRSRP